MHSIPICEIQGSKITLDIKNNAIHDFHTHALMSTKVTPYIFITSYVTFFLNFGTTVVSVVAYYYYEPSVASHTTIYCRNAKTIKWEL